MNIQVVLLGSSGIPGRYILSSLLELKSHRADTIHITVVKRPGSNTTTPEDVEDYSIAWLESFDDTDQLVHTLRRLAPDIIISALNAEPEPFLDNLVVNGILQYRANTTKQVFFINGYTLDLLHPSVDDLSATAKSKIAPKIDFASRLQRLATEEKIEYCTIVNAAFLDYCLMKGYSAVNLEKRTANLIGGGNAIITGCSLRFVGDAVAMVVRLYALESGESKNEVRNKRLRIAETVYSGAAMTRCVEKITGGTLTVQHDSLQDILESGAVIRYLNWAGTGASNFAADGFVFGKDTLVRRDLTEICNEAIEEGVQVFERGQ